MEKFAAGALLFDMDGLMVDSEPLWARVERDFCSARGGVWTDEHARANVGRGVRTTLATMRELFGFEVDLDRDAAAIVDAFVARAGELELKPGLPSLLDAADGRVPMAVVSSSDRRLVDAVLGRFDLARRFAAVVTGEAAARPKPAPDIFLYAARRVGVEPRRCVVLEDSVAGATAGHAAGMHVIAVPEGPIEGRGFEAVSDRVARDLVEARAWIDLPASRERGGS